MIKLVTVSITQLINNILGPYRPKYAVLVDVPPNKVIEFLKKNDRTFIFPFYTKSLQKVPDILSLLKTKGLYMIVPMCVEKFSNPKETIQAVVKIGLGKDFDNAIKVEYTDN